MIKKYIGVITTIIFLVAFGVYFFLNTDKFTPILDLSVGTIVIVALSKVLLLVSNSLFLKEILKHFEKNITHIESLYITILSTAGNYFIPMRGGAGIRAVYLNKKFKFPYSHFLSTLSGNYIIIFLLNSFIGLVALGAISIRNEVYPGHLFLFFAGVFFSTLFLSIFKTPTFLFDRVYKIPLINKITDTISKIVNGWNDIIASKMLVLKLIVFALVNFSSAVIAGFVEFNALGIDISIWGLMLYSALASLTILISFTPGSLGIREAVFLIFSGVIGITNIEVLQVALIDRGIMFFVLIILFIVAKIFPQE